MQSGKNTANPCLPHSIPLELPAQDRQGACKQSTEFREAAQWHREQTASIKDAPKNSGLPLELEVKQAHPLWQLQQRGAMNSLYGPETVDGCFTKGMPITTREGWKPIEEIQVGDWVLSRPEDGSGKPEYKHVVKTFVFEEKTIGDISYSEPDGNHSVFVTGNHLFWVEGVGWTRADILKKGNLPRLKEGSTGKVTDQFPVYQFLDPISGEPEVGIGWTQNSKHPLANPATSTS
jgi:hypothetical protein